MYVFMIAECAIQSYTDFQILINRICVYIEVQRATSFVFKELSDKIFLL